MTDDIKACCEIESNLKEERVTDDLVVRTCQECGCRHFELSVDAAKLGVVFENG